MLRDSSIIYCPDHSLPARQNHQDASSHNICVILGNLSSRIHSYSFSDLCSRHSIHDSPNNSTINVSLQFDVHSKYWQHHIMHSHVTKYINTMTLSVSARIYLYKYFRTHSTYLNKMNILT